MTSKPQGARRLEFRVAPEHEGMRLDLFIIQCDQSLTRSQVKGLVEKGRVSVDGKSAGKAGELIEKGQLVKIEIPATEKLDLTPHEVGIEILYEDEDLAVLEKPAGVSVHPSETEKGPTVVHGLLLKLKTLSSVGGVERPGIVHRIDKGTSGILVVSKTDQAHLGLSAQFKAHTIDRRYRALVYGEPNKSGKIETFFGRNPNHRKKMTGKLTEGRKAITHWQTLSTYGAVSLIECRLETGRTHQIRVHLSEMGFPIVGDPLYCDNERRARAFAKKQPRLSANCLALNHQLLHAFRLGFKHPNSGKHLEFESPLPNDFTATLELARSNA